MLEGFKHCIDKFMLNLSSTFDRIRNLGLKWSEEEDLKRQANRVNTQLILKLEKAENLSQPLTLLLARFHSLGRTRSLVRFLTLSLCLVGIYIALLAIVNIRFGNHIMFLDLYVYIALVILLPLIAILERLQARKLDLTISMMRSSEIELHKARELEKLLKQLKQVQDDNLSSRKLDIAFLVAAMLFPLVPYGKPTSQYSTSYETKENLITFLASSPEIQEEMIAHYREFRYALLKMKPKRLYTGLKLWEKTYELCKAIVILRVQNFLAPDSAETK